MQRRRFLVASTLGFAGLTFGQPARSAIGGGAASRAATAKSTILFFLCGGASHLDMWDLKPTAPLEYRGPFQPIATSAAGVRLCEHLPLLARQAHHLALVNSVGAKVNTNDHHAGYYYNFDRSRAGSDVSDAGQQPHAICGRLAVHGGCGRCEMPAA
jgi:hypothetical protein